MSTLLVCLRSCWFVYLVVSCVVGSIVLVGHVFALDLSAPCLFVDCAFDCAVVLKLYVPTSCFIRLSVWLRRGDEL